MVNYLCKIIKVLWNLETYIIFYKIINAGQPLLIYFIASQILPAQDLNQLSTLLMTATLLSGLLDFGFHDALISRAHSLGSFTNRILKPIYYYKSFILVCFSIFTYSAFLNGVILNPFYCIAIGGLRSAGDLLDVFHIQNHGNRAARWMFIITLSLLVLQVTTLVFYKRFNGDRHLVLFVISCGLGFAVFLKMLFFVFRLKSNFFKILPHEKKFRTELRTYLPFLGMYALGLLSSNYPVFCALFSEKIRMTISDYYGASRITVIAVTVGTVLFSSMYAEMSILRSEGNKGWKTQKKYKLVMSTIIIFYAIIIGFFGEKISEKFAGGDLRGFHKTIIYQSLAIPFVLSAIVPGVFLPLNGRQYFKTFAVLAGVIVSACLIFLLKQSLDGQRLSIITSAGLIIQSILIWITALVHKDVEINYVNCIVIGSTAVAVVILLVSN